MKFITLTQGYKARVDDDDYERVIKHKWLFSYSSYAARSVIDKITHKKSILFLHNFVNPPPEGFTNDHINRNRLDCRKENLRFATRTQQMINRVNENQSGFRGVFPKGNNWMVIVTNKGNRYYGGTYGNIINAAKVYDKLAKRYHGEFAILNFPQSTKDDNHV